jgi:transglutaminase-like putative cysteine protease
MFLYRLPRTARLLVICGLAIASQTELQAQSGDRGKETPVTQTWRVGANIQTAARPVTNLLVTFPVPVDWPEQQVNVYQENIPAEASRADFRDSEGVRQMVARIPRINERSEVDINVILDITVSPVPYPDRTDHLVVPQRPPRDVRLCLSPSPLIESRERNIRNQARELVEGVEIPWEQVRKLYQFVTSEISVEGKQVIGASKTLKQKQGSAEDLGNLFIALCRAIKVPARMVWAHGAEYTEFYLQDDSGEGRWYPVVLEGQPEFGQMSHPRVIIQKGDNVKVPEKSQRQRFVVESVTGSGRQGARPKVRFVRDVLPARDR